MMGGGSGALAWKMWSVNTWIIVICVAVFVLDGVFLPSRVITMSEPVPMEGIDRIPSSAVMLKMPNLDAKMQVGELARRPMIIKGTNQQVGWVTVQKTPFLESLLHFSTRLGFLKVEFWRFVGFQFLHSHGMLMHIVFNMIGLFFFGPMVEQVLGGKRYLAFYLLCGIFGALMYSLLNIGGIIAITSFGMTSAPLLLFNDLSTPLIGASAGVYGVLMAGAFLAPNARVLVFGIIPMKLKTMAYVVFAMAVYSVLFGGHNAGGEAGHLGGAIAGFYFIRNQQHLHGFFDFLGRVDPTSHHYRGARKKVKPVKARAEAGSTAEVDRILDKISTQGLQSLTAKEKKTLHNASK